MNPGLNPGLLFNAQLALAAQHPALFGHYSGHSPSSPLNVLKGHRFSPYSLPSGLGSAFDAVTPGSNSGGPRSLSSSPRPRPSSSSPTNRPISVSPTPISSIHSKPVSNSPSELKSIEKMVNGLDVQPPPSINGLLDETKPPITTDQWHMHIDITSTSNVNSMQHAHDLNAWRNCWSPCILHNYDRVIIQSIFI